MLPKLSEYTLHEFILALKNQGILLLREEDLKETAKFYAKKKSLMRCKWVSACAVADYQLLNTHPSRKTVKTMINDGRFMAHEAKKEGKKQMVLVTAINRINNN